MKKTKPEKNPDGTYPEPQDHTRTSNEDYLRYHHMNYDASSMDGN